LAAANSGAKQMKQQQVICGHKLRLY